MTSTIKVLNDTDAVRGRYAACVEAWDEATVYHTIEWLGVFESLSAHLVFLELDGQTLIPFVCKGRGRFARAYSLPYDTYGGAVGPNHGPIPYVELLAALNVPSARIVDFGGARSNTPGPIEPVTTHIVALDPDYDRVARLYTPMNRKALRQADKRGLRITVIEDASELGLFYALYCRTAIKYGRPRLPRKFFDAIYQLMGAAGLARLYLAWSDRTPVACNLVLRYKRRAYDWMWAYDERHQRLRPTNALLDRAIRDEIAAGTVDLNLGTSPAYDEGSVQFKENFGAKPYVYAILSKSNLTYAAARTLKRVIDVPISFLIRRSARAFDRSRTDAAPAAPTDTRP